MPRNNSRRTDPKRQRAYRKGRRAEWFASQYLRLLGFRILERRYKTPVGEIDLIARKRDLVIFVEVKARSNVQTALDSVTRTAQQRIESAASWWLSQHRDAARLSWRFDVIAIVPLKWPIHFRDVW